MATDDNSYLGATDIKISSAILKKIETTCKDPPSMSLKLTAALFNETILATSNVEGLNGRKKLDEGVIDAILSE